MSTHLWDNTIGPETSNGGFGGGFELGMAFDVTADCQLVAFHWEAMNATTTDKPTRFHLWNRTTGQLILTENTVPHSGSVGWQTQALGTPFNLYAGGEYVVSANFAGGTHMGSLSAISVPPSPFVYQNTGKGLQSGFGAVDVLPTSVSATAWAVDVAVDPGSSPPSGGSALTYEAFNAKLDSWFLDTGDNTHQTDGVPYETWTLATDIKTIVDNIPRATDAPWVDVLKLWQIAGALTSLEIAAWNAFAQRAPSQLTGGTGGGGSAFFASGGRQVAQAASDTLDVTSLLLALRRNALVDFPGAPWVMTDETAFDTDTAYTEEADLYVVTFTDLGSNIVNTVAAGVDVSYRLAWWAPLIGAFAQQRRFIDTPSAHLWLDGTRLPGVLLHSPAGAAGTIQAWTYA